MKTICIYHSRDLEPIKRCSTCDIFKVHSLFSNNKSTKDGKHNQCKLCNKGQSEKYRKNNIDKIRNHRKAKYYEDVEQSKKEGREQYQKHKKRKLSQNKKWRELHELEISEYQHNWYLKNREHKLRKNTEWEKNEMTTNPGYRLQKNLRIRINNALRGKVKSGKTFDLLGCNLEEFKKYLEVQFNNKMTWENYGSYWHVDHKIPCAIFDLSIEEQQKICFHYRNLQPLETIKNMSKKDKLITNQLNLML